MESHCIPRSRLPGSSALFLDYLDHFERVSTFYGAGAPFEISSFHKVAGSTEYSTDLRQQVVRILTRQNEAFGATAETSANLRRLGEPGTFAVVTGQQAGFFSGPAFTLYKALTAVCLAHRLSEQGLPSVPVFWLATEDHDLKEVASTIVLDDEGKLVTLGDPGNPAAPQASVGNVLLTGAVTQALSQLELTIPPGTARDRLLSDLRDAYRPGMRWGEAFARFLARVFGRWGVLLLDALDPELHRLSQPAYSKAIAEAATLNARLRERSKALIEAGYHAQVHVAGQHTLMFADHAGSRLPLRLADGGRAFKPEGGPQWSANEALRFADAHPEAITPNALFRPVIQDLLLPTVAYVAGPAEIAYHAQSAALYEAFERPQPVIVPRASFTLIDPRTARLLNEYDLTVEDAWQGEAHLRRRIASAGFSPGWEERVSRSEQEIIEIMENLRPDVLAIDPTLLDAIERAQTRTAYQFERLKGKITRAAFARSEVLERHERWLGTFLTPTGVLQERGLGGVYFLGRAGYDLLEQLLALVSFESAGHLVVPFQYPLP